MVGKIFTASGLIGLMLFIISTTIVGCDKEKSPEFVEMTFVIPFSVTPIRSIKIGDTLWLSADFPDTILELNSMKYYKLINMDFKELFAVFKLSNNDLTISQQPGGLNAFTILEKKGTLNDPSETFADLKFSYANEKYSFMAGFVPSTVGIYCINFTWPREREGFDAGLHLENYIDLGVTNDGRKRIPRHKATYVVINNGETNFDLFHQNCKAVSLSVPIVEANVYYEQKGTFTFQVVQ